MSMRAIVVTIAVAVCALTATLAQVHHPKFEIVELSTHRLPTYVRPLHYHLDLDLARGHTYTGVVQIEVEFTGPTSQTNKATRCLRKLTHVFTSLGQSSKCPRAGKNDRIVLHSDKSVRIDSVGVKRVVPDKREPNGEKLKVLKIKKFGADQEKQLFTIDLASELPPAGSRGVIELTFSANLRTDNTGIYLSKSRVRGKEYFQVAAKFQPTFARLAMPCFDEPAYKAKFSLTIKHLAEHRAYATTNLIKPLVDGWKIITEGVKTSKFETTPLMSIHMFAFTLGNFDEPLELQVRDNLRLRAITPMHKREAGAYALEVAKFAIEWFEKYIDFKFPLKKLDLVAFPDMDTDNTETWGLVFVRDILALIDDETKQDTRITTAVNVAHVVVHQWFANLITAEWWNDMWITESVAAQMAFEIVADLFPEQSEYFVRISTLSGILTSDSSGKNHSLSPPESELSTSKQVYTLFDNIQFMKSGALARLQQDTLGREKFREILQKLVRRHAFSNVDFNDLIEVISDSYKSSDVPIEEILSSWSKLKSYPVVNVAFNKADNKLSLYEEPRPLARNDQVVPPSGQYQNQWVLPLKVLVSDASGEHQETKEIVLGAQNSQSSVDLPAWFEAGRDYVKVSPNPSLATYYRVRYSDELLQPLKAPIEEKKLATMDRLHLLDDSRALAAASLLKPDTYKEFLGWYASDTEAAMIIEMLLSIRTLSTLKTTDPSSSPVAAVFLNLYRRDGFRVTGKETLLEQRARMVTLNALIKVWEVKEVIHAGVRAYDESNRQVSLFLREPVYAAVVASGSDEQVQHLMGRLELTPSHEEQIRLANALSEYTRNVDILDELERWLEGSDLKEVERAPIRATISKSRVHTIKRQESDQ